jgi:hypothetical protein
MTKQIPQKAEQATVEGFNETVRISRKRTDTQEMFSVTLDATEMPLMRSWVTTLASLACEIVKVYFSSMEPPPPFVTGEQAIQLQAALLMKNAAGILSGIDIIDRMLIDFAEHGANHPGSIELPNEVEECEDARQVASLWIVPTEGECPDCHNHHERIEGFVGTSAIIPAKKFGEMLAQAASGYAMEKASQPGESLSLRMEIESAFHEAMSHYFKDSSTKEH